MPEDPVVTTAPGAESILRALQDLAREEPIRLRVAGDSMAPLAGDGSFVTVSRARLHWPGDVIAFVDRDGDLVLHRVIGYRPGGKGLKLLAQGDRCASADAPIGADRVVGRVCGGDGSVLLRRVPLHHRLTALARFVRYVLKGLAARLR